MKETIIPLFFSFNRNYCIPAAVAIHSMLKYADKNYFYRLYVLHTELKTNDERKLQKIVQSFNNASLEFMNISECDLDAAWKNVTAYHYSKETMSRLFADILFPQYNKIIYSDVDVVFSGDVSQAWFEPKKEPFYVAGVKHGGGKTDITNAGFLVMNLQKIREDKMGQQWREMMTGWNDQDIINACCEPALLPLRFNVCQVYYRTKNVLRTDVYSQEEVSEALKKPVMIHYITSNKPWNTLFSQKQKVWLKELIGTGLAGGGDLFSGFPCCF
jgi:lipopolysaccharide biosynthesis glycosyltransferase